MFAFGIHSGRRKGVDPIGECLTRQTLLVVTGGIETLELSLPAVVTTELRLNVPRYASLPGIMKARRKPIKDHKIGDLIGAVEPRVKIIKMSPPPQRKAGEIVADVATLVDKLKNEAKVI